MSVHKMYYWGPKSGEQGGVGHASLDIDFGAGPGKADYVSWWPGGTGNKGDRGASASTPFETFPAALNTYPSDISSRGEGRDPDDTVFITDILDANRMRTKFNEMKKTLTYTITTKSCATAVADVLMAGGGSLSINCVNFAAKIRIWTPHDSLLLANMIVIDGNTIKKGVANGFTIPFQFVWPDLSPSF